MKSTKGKKVMSSAPAVIPAKAGIQKKSSSRPQALVHSTGRGKIGTTVSRATSTGAGTGEISWQARDDSVPVNAASKGLLGFWIYLMTDCILFASLFATFMVLRGATASGANGADIFSLPFVFAETFILLVSSLTSGLALLAAHRHNKSQTLRWLAATGGLGVLFLGLELYEFRGLVLEGHSWTQSAFLSSYFGLVGTHGLHILLGLVWLVATALYLHKCTFTPRFMQRLTMFTMFWHFLDIVWVGIFTIVYLLGVL